MRCEEADTLVDGRLVSPSAERNKGPILAVLERVLPETGVVLEIASGTGQHVVHFARHLGRLTWQPTDPDAGCRRSISAWIAAERLPNVRRPLDLDVCAPPWPIADVDALVCINLLHIAPWRATGALFSGARLALRAGGPVYLYGPYFMPGRPTAPSNEAFDRALRAQNPEWGVRSLEAVVGLAEEHGFEFADTIEMPANNLSVLFRRRQTTPA